MKIIKEGTPTRIPEYTDFMIRLADEEEEEDADS